MRGVQVDNISIASGIINVEYSALINGQVRPGRVLEMSVDDFNEFTSDSGLSILEMLLFLMKSAKNRGLPVSALIGKRIKVDFTSATPIEII